MANVKRKIVQKAAQWIKSRPNSTDNMTRGPIDRSINVFGIRRGPGVENIPDNLMTRPKPGERGTLGLTKAQKEAAKKSRQKELGVSSRPVPKNPNKSNVPAKPRYTKSTGTNKGGQQLNPGERRKY